MKNVFITFILTLSLHMAQAQENTLTQYVKTKMGQIAVYQKKVETDKTPLILLHGIYFDHHLWDEVVAQTNDRTVITLDMPLHGNSKNEIPQQWNLDDCGEMLYEVIEALKLPKAIAIGHSWGSMTVLRAASKHPERFEAIGLGNMPFEEASQKQKLTFGLQHSMLAFRNFYTKQAGKSLFANTSLQEKPALMSHLQTAMNKLSNSEIKHIDKNVIIKAQDASALLQSLKVPALALKGQHDFVPTPTQIETTVVKGGHVSPLESPKEVLDIIQKLTLLSSTQESNAK